MGFDFRQRADARQAAIPAGAWLMLAPALVPFFFQMGRGLGNTGFVLAWVALAVLVVKQRAWRAVPMYGALVLWILLLVSGGVSAALSIAPADAMEKWVRYAWMGSIYFLMAMLLSRRDHPALGWMLERIGWIGLASFGWLLGHTLLTYDIPGFQPQFHIRGLVPAYLSPFVLYWMARRFTGMTRSGVMGAYSIVLAWLLVHANSLTEVLALAAALFVLAMFRVPTLRLRLGVLTALLAGFVALILAFDPAGKVIVSNAPGTAVQTDGNAWIAFADKLSSQRTLIWRQAVATPPPNPWLGVGAGNVGAFSPVRMEGLGAVKHLHNLFLDMWYELGFIGAALLLALSTGQFVHALRRRDPATMPLLYAATAAILVAALLEQSYRSYHLALFLPFLFALFAYAPRAESSRAPA
ncbi:MAG: O-antigen ligase family protein [Pseudomonadota bacterium]